MEKNLIIVLYGSLLVHIVLMVFIARRLWTGENVIDRLMAFDMLGNMTMAVLVLAALIHRQRIFVDVSLGLAALGYITIIALAKYIADRRVI